MDGFSDKESEVFDTEFEIDEDDFFELSACSGKCFKVENGVAVISRDVFEHITSHKEQPISSKKSQC